MVGDEITYLGPYTGGIPRIYWGWEKTSRIFHPGSGREIHMTRSRVGPRAEDSEWVTLMLAVVRNLAVALMHHYLGSSWES